MEWFRQFLAIYDRIRPVLDVAILAFLQYKVYELLEKTQTLQLVKSAAVTPFEITIDPPEIRLNLERRLSRTVSVTPVFRGNGLVEYRGVIE